MCYIARWVNSCDFTQTEYSESVEGVAAIARGASGRWCEVMWGGSEYKAELEEKNVPILSYEDAYKWVEENGEEGDWCDF